MWLAKAGLAYCAGVLGITAVAWLGTGPPMNRRPRSASWTAGAHSVESLLRCKGDDRDGQGDVNDVLHLGRKSISEDESFEPYRRLPRRSW